jgi:para-aminobenzoate synthetase component I
VDSPKLTVVLEEWIDPEDVFQDLIADEQYSFWLDSGPGATDGMSYLGAASAGSRIALASVAEGSVRVFGSPQGEAESVHPGTIFDYLRLDDAWKGSGPAEFLEQYDPGEADGEDGSVPLGWIGWFGYEAGADRLGVPARTAETPDAALLWVDRLIAFDHSARTVALVGWDVPDVRSWAARTATRLVSSPRQGSGVRGDAVESRRASFPRTVRWRHDSAAYLRMIGDCRQSIHRGDAYQICLTNEVRVEPSADPVAAYLRLRQLNESHHGGYLRFGEFTLLSTSPEQFLLVDRTRHVTTRPIKGTRGRGATLEEDEELRAELSASDKERAENVMIVDLMRNDLSRVCAPGTVEVSELLAVETYPHVHQLVSSVTGLLALGRTTIDAIEACFPAGSMTGAPKLSAMRILHGLENGPRGVYAGCFGYLAHDGSSDLAMVIRSIVMDGHGSTIGTGGGITALSDPHEELAEARLKAAVLLEVLAAAPARTGRSASGEMFH